MLIKKKLYIKLTAVSLCNSCTFFILPLFTSSLGLTTMVFFRWGVVVTFHRCYELHLVAAAAFVVAFVAANVVVGGVSVIIFYVLFMLFALLLIWLLFFLTFLDFSLRFLTFLLMLLVFFVCAFFALFCFVLFFGRSFWFYCSLSWCCLPCCCCCCCWFFCYDGNGDVDGADILIYVVDLLLKNYGVLVYIDGVLGDLVGFLVDVIGISVDVVSFRVDVSFWVLTTDFCIGTVVAAVLISPH